MRAFALFTVFLWRVTFDQSDRAMKQFSAFQNNIIVDLRGSFSPKSSHRITDHFDCVTPNVIYCIQCTACNHLYVGETGRRLGDRIRDHIRDIGVNDNTKPVSRHFNSANHNIHHMIVFGLCLISGTNDDRKSKEMRLIHSLGTQHPHGMNERFSFI